MVPGQQYIQDAGVALAEGKADPGEMGLHQMFPCPFRPHQKAAHLFLFHHGSCFLSLFQFKLACVQFIIPSSLVNQFFVATALYDFSLFQHHNGLGVADRGQPVGDHK